MMQYVMASSFAGVAGLALHSTTEPIYEPLDESLDQTSGLLCTTRETASRRPSGERGALLPIPYDRSD